MASLPNPPETVAGTNGRFVPVRRVLEDAIDRGAFPGCAFGALAGGKIVLQGALGRFTYEPDSPSVTPETVYDVASLTKVVSTTAIAMLLHQRGQLELETPVGEILPGFVVGRPPGDHAREVTLRHLLAHNSGLPDYVEFYRTSDTPVALLRACLEIKLEAEPGTRAEYSDPGFILLGKALEVLLHEDLASWGRREIYGPLGLAATGYLPPSARRESIPPTENDTQFRHRVIQGEVQDENAFMLKGISGHAGLFSNVPDMLGFAGEILTSIKAKSDASKDSCLFRPETVQLFAQRQAPKGSARALGWDTPSENSTSGQLFSPHSIGHLGFSGCSLWIDLEAAVAVVLLTNRTWPDRSSRVIGEVRPAFHDAVRRAIAIP